MKWVTLPFGLDLGNVRAITTLLISVLCVFGIWSVGFFRWKRHAAKVSNHASVGLFDLLVVSSAGEALDTTTAVIKAGRVSFHLFLLVQCALVATLSVLAMLAGPIARFSITNGFEVTRKDISGAMATTNNTNIHAAMVKWNLTIHRLNEAEFPDSELLDFLPDVHADWQYVSSEWNSSWKMIWDYTPLTEIPIKAERVISEDFLDQIPDIRSAYPSGPQGSSSIPFRESKEIGGFYADNLFRDLLLFVLLSTSPSTNSTDTFRMNANNETMRMVFFAFHLHNIPRGNEKSYFGVGTAEKASYTRADCSITRSEVPDTTHISYLWTNDTYSVVTAFSEFHKANLVEQSIGNETIYHPTGPDLVRFFQAYMITKDTQFNHAVTRSLSVRQKRLRISLAALVVFVLYVIVLGVLLLWSYFMYPVQGGIFIPRTKVDWVMETVREVLARDFNQEKLEASPRQLCADISSSAYGEVTSPSGRQFITLRAHPL